MTCTTTLHPKPGPWLEDRWIETVASDPRACQCYVRYLEQGGDPYCPACLRRKMLLHIEIQAIEDKRIYDDARARAEAVARYTEEELAERSRLLRETRAAQKRYVSPRRRMAILQRDGFKCGICGRTAEANGVTLHVDHQQPLSKGGSNEDENLWTLCDECNLAKSNRL